MLRVRLLGELQIQVDGDPVEPPASRRARGLLAWLALHPGEHARGTVAARFWPDVLDSSARASLRSAAWTLRRELGPAAEGALTAGRDRIGLRCETDLTEFEAHIAAGRLREAVELCSGPLLAELDDDWVLEARDEHSERLAAALTRLAAGAATPQEAMTWARRRLTLDPLDEEAARDLMRRLTAAGDRAAALAVYERLSDRLRTGLGLAPSPDTRALATGVRDEQPAATMLDMPTSFLESFNWFAAGMALAVASVHGALPARRGVANGSWAAAAVLILAFPWLMLWWPHGGSLDIWQNLVLGMISALVVLPAVLPEGTGGSLPQRILSTRLAAWLGLVSYSIYLFHLGVLSAIFKLELQDIVPGRTVLSYTLVALPVTLVLAALSYYLVERPALKFKSPRRQMVLPRLTSATKKVQQPVEP